MIPLLPKWYLMPNRPSFYDTDSKTLLELASTLSASMNNLIEDYNNFVDSVNDRLTEFTENSTENQEQFAVGLRQEFQDFINIVELKIAGFNMEIENFTNQANDKLIEMDNRITGLYADQVPVTQRIINEAIETGSLTIVESYNEQSESLDLILTGGV